jgi:hypothetical protein
MPYFKNDIINLLLIHIPKTGGTSIEIYLSKKYSIPLNHDSLYMYLSDREKHNSLFNTSLQHLHYSTIIENNSLLNIDMNNLKVIACVRNPYTRVISDLFFLNLIAVTSNQRDVFKVLKKYLQKSFDRHHIQQYRYITDHNKLIYPNISILHTETLNDDMIKLGYDDFNIQTLKNPKNIGFLDYYSYLNKDSILLINNFYHDDFIIFNYRKIEIT